MWRGRLFRRCWRNQAFPRARQPEKRRHAYRQGPGEAIGQGVDQHGQPLEKGAAQAAAGETALGGRIPVCTSGGCLSRGHPAYITGLLTIYELWEQLTRRAGERQVVNARLGAGSCELGNYNAALIHILEAAA